MWLLIECAFEDGPQTLIKDPASEADVRAIQASADDPDTVLGIRCRLTPDGPDRLRLVRVGCITGLRLEESQ